MNHQDARLRAMNRQDAKSAKKNKSQKPFLVLKFDLLFLALLAYPSGGY